MERSGSGREDSRAGGSTSSKYFSSLPKPSSSPVLSPVANEKIIEEEHKNNCTINNNNNNIQVEKPNQENFIDAMDRRQPFQHSSPANGQTITTTIITTTTTSIVDDMDLIPEDEYFPSECPPGNNNVEKKDNNNSDINASTLSLVPGICTHDILNNNNNNTIPITSSHYEESPPEGKRITRSSSKKGGTAKNKRIIQDEESEEEKGGSTRNSSDEDYIEKESMNNDDDEFIVDDDDIDLDGSPHDNMPLTKRRRRLSSRESMDDNNMDLTRSVNTKDEKGLNESKIGCGIGDDSRIQISSCYSASSVDIGKSVLSILGFFTSTNFPNVEGAKAKGNFISLCLSLSVSVSQSNRNNYLCSLAKRSKIQKGKRRAILMAG